MTGSFRLGVSVVLVALLVTLSACGGGGVGSSGNSADTEPMAFVETQESDVLENTPSGNVVGGYILAIPKPGITITEINRAINGKGWEVVGGGIYSGLLQIKLNKSDYSNMVAARDFLLNLNIFDDVSFDSTANLSVSYKPIDPPYFGQNSPPYNHVAISLPNAWDIVYKNINSQSPFLVPIGVVEGGFSGKSGYDIQFDSVAGGGNNIFCGLVYCEEHGYHVAGIFGATANNELGIVGVGSGLYKVSLRGYATHGLKRNIIETVAMALADNVMVINISMGNDGLPNKSSQILNIAQSDSAKQNAIDTATTLAVMLNRYENFNKINNRPFNTLFVQSSGNSGGSFFTNTNNSFTKISSEFNGYFSSLELSKVQISSELKKRIIIVGATDNKNAITEFTQIPVQETSNFIVAPGVDIESTGIKKLLLMTGTSMAAPHVTGVAALIWQVNPQLSATEVRDIILHNSDTVDGYRSLNAEKAVRAASEALSKTPTGTLKYTGGESYPLRASFTINSAGNITGGQYDFHKLDGTMTPCTYSVANDATCHGASNTFSITSQSGPLTSSGAASPITLNAGPDSYGFIFNGTMTGTTWSGTWTNSTQTGGGTFSVNVGISTPATNSFIGNIGSTAVSYQTNRLIAGSDQTNFQNLFRAGLFFNIPKSTEYDNVAVIGLGLPGSGLKLVNSPYSGSELILDDGSGNTYFLPNTFAPDAIPSGSTYLVRKYKGETYVGADQLYLGNRVIAPSEMTSAMFPTISLTTYAQLCPGGMPIGGTNSTFWWSMPVKQGNTASGANLTCDGSAASININVRDSSGYTFSLVQTVWAAP